MEENSFKCCHLKRSMCVKTPRWEGIWWVLRVTKTQYARKVVSNKKKEQSLVTEVYQILLMKDKA